MEESNQENKFDLDIVEWLVFLKIIALLRFSQTRSEIEFHKPSGNNWNLCLCLAVSINILKDLRLSNQRDQAFGRQSPLSISSEEFQRAVLLPSMSSCLLKKLMGIIMRENLAVVKTEIS